MLAYSPEKKLPEQRSTVGRRLRILRMLFGYSQREIAALLKIHRSTYTYYELDKAMPSVATVITLASYYQVSTDYLLGLGEDDSIFEQPLFQKKNKEERPE